MKKICKEKNKGITLIALIITIIVLIILSGVTIRWITSDDGILNKTISAQEIQIKQAIRESLNLELTNILSGHISDSNETSKELSLDEFERLGYDVQKEEDEENTKCYIIEDGYVFEIEEREDGSQEVVFVATENEMKPKIIDVYLSIDDSKLKIETNAKRVKEYSYFINSNKEIFKQENIGNNIIEVDLKELDEENINGSKGQDIFGDFTVKVTVKNDNNRWGTDNNPKYSISKTISVSKITFDANGGKFENSEEKYIAFLETGKKLNTINTTEISEPTLNHFSFDDWYIGDKKLVLDEAIINETIATISAQWNYIEHNYVFARTVKEATCTEDGEEIKACTLCGEEKSVAVAMLGHSYTRESTDSKYKKTDATCTQVATYYKSCERCGIASAAETFASGSTVAHSYTSTSTDVSHRKSTATCKSAAVYYKSCVWCGTNGTDTFTSGSTAAHSYTSTSTDSSHVKSTATCQSAAVYYKSCVWCGTNGSDTFTSGSTANHSYSSKTTTSTYLKSSATCQSAAVYYYKCQWCTAKGTSTYTSGSKASHSYTANCSGCSGNGYTWKSANANWYYCYKGSHCIVINRCDTHSASGLSGGYTAIKVCSKCGSSSSLYKPLSSKGTGKQCKWCGTAKK